MSQGKFSIRWTYSGSEEREVINSPWVQNAILWDMWVLGASSQVKAFIHSRLIHEWIGFMLETRDRWDELRTRIGAHCLHLLENYTSVPPLPKLHEAKETSLYGETERIGTMNLLFQHGFEKLQAADFMKKDEQTKVDWNFENAYLRAKKLICFDTPSTNLAYLVSRKSSPNCILQIKVW